MACIHNCPICPSNTIVFTALKNSITILVGLLKAIEHRVNARTLRGQDEISVNIVLETGRWQTYFTGEEPNTARAYDATSNDDSDGDGDSIESRDSDLGDERINDCRNDVDDPDRIEMILDVYIFH